MCKPFSLFFCLFLFRFMRQLTRFQLAWSVKCRAVPLRQRSILFHAHHASMTNTQCVVCADWLARRLAFVTCDFCESPYARNWRKWRILDSSSAAIFHLLHLMTLASADAAEQMSSDLRSSEDDEINHHQLGVRRRL